MTIQAIINKSCQHVFTWNTRSKICATNFSPCQVLNSCHCTFWQFLLLFDHFLIIFKNFTLPGPQHSQWEWSSCPLWGRPPSLQCRNWNWQIRKHECNVLIKEEIISWMNNGSKKYTKDCKFCSGGTEIAILVLIWKRESERI